MPRSISRRLALVVATVTFAIGIPLGVVIAAAGFNDVSDSNIFKNDIAAIAAAGVTTGCGGGNYCPKDNVTREQMAAFMNRLGALAPGKTPVVNADKLDGNDSSAFVMHGQEVTVQVDPVSMLPRYPSQDTVEGRGYANGGVHLNKTSAGGGMVAAVRVPVGATLKSATAYFYDFGTGDITVMVRSTDMPLGGFDQHGNTMTSTGKGGYESDSTLLEDHVIYSGDSLSVLVQGATDLDHVFYGVLITYLMP